MSALNAGLATLATWLRANLAWSTVIWAVMASAGVMLVCIGAFSIQRESLSAEYLRVHGIRALSTRDRARIWLAAAGLAVSPLEFAATAVFCGLALAGVMWVLGFATLGIGGLVLGPAAYIALLTHKRARLLRAFGQALPDAIDDFAERLPAALHDLAHVVAQMAKEGPEETRAAFAQVYALERRGVPLEDALRQSGRARPEAMWRWLVDVLADARQYGNQETGALLKRIAAAQRTQVRLQKEIHAKQAGARIVRLLYSLAPFAFLLLMTLAGYDGSTRFYASATGQAVQLGVMIAGLGTWVLCGKIAGRGLALHTPVHEIDVRAQYEALVAIDATHGADTPASLGQAWRRHAPPPTSMAEADAFVRVSVAAQEFADDGAAAWTDDAGPVIRPFVAPDVYADTAVAHAFAEAPETDARDAHVSTDGVDASGVIGEAGVIRPVGRSGQSGQSEQPGQPIQPEPRATEAINPTAHAASEPVTADAAGAEAEAPLLIDWEAIIGAQLSADAADEAPAAEPPDRSPVAATAPSPEPAAADTPAAERAQPDGWFDQLLSGVDMTQPRRSVRRVARKTARPSAPEEGGAHA